MGQDWVWWDGAGLGVVGWGRVGRRSKLHHKIEMSSFAHFRKKLILLSFERGSPRPWICPCRLLLCQIARTRCVCSGAYSQCVYSKGARVYGHFSTSRGRTFRETETDPWKMRLMLETKALGSTEFNRLTCTHFSQRFQIWKMQVKILKMVCLTLEGQAKRMCVMRWSVFWLAASSTVSPCVRSVSTQRRNAL